MAVHAGSATDLVMEGVLAACAGERALLEAMRTENARIREAKNLAVLEREGAEYREVEARNAVTNKKREMEEMIARMQREINQLEGALDSAVSEKEHTAAAQEKSLEEPCALLPQVRPLSHGDKMALALDGVVLMSVFSCGNSLTILFS